MGLGVNGDIWYLYPRTPHKTSFMLSIKNIAAVWIIEFIAGTFKVSEFVLIWITHRHWAVCMIFRLSLHIKKANALYIDHVFSVLCQSVTSYLKLYPWTVLHILQRGYRRMSAAGILTDSKGYHYFNWINEQDAATSQVVSKQVINLWSCSILLVDSVESMMMHGLANRKSKV